MSAESNSEEKIREEAKKRVKAKRSFFKHLAIYGAIVVLVIIIWATVGRGSTWWIWPLLVWGLGILAYYLAVFVFPHGVASKLITEQTEWTKRRTELLKKDAEWKKKQIENEVQKLKKSDLEGGER